MPMRKSTIHACALGVTLSSSLLASANAASWNGSYVADGECFCTGSQGREIDSQIIPTPIGGQSVSQVCDRLGDGPALQKVNGKFNFPVYADAQCGNGPFSTESASTDNEQCSGHLGVEGEDCVGQGPKWDIKSAYAKPADIKPGSSQSSSVTGASIYIDPQTKQSASVSNIANTASTPVTQIVAARSNSQPIVQAVPVTPEALRARQIVQMEAARERARLRASETENLELILTEEQIALNAKAAEEALAQSAKDDAIRSAKADAIRSESTAATLPTTSTALKLPVSTRNSARGFDYIEGLPVSYDFGGAGMRVGASISNSHRMQFLLNASVAESYGEALAGVGVFLNPQSIDGLTVLLSTGIEYGKFEFQGSGVSANLSSTGAYVGLSSRYVVTPKFELQAGVGYSSFFEGDAIAYGSAFYHLTPKLDLTTKAEIGDNDSFGFGIRYYY